MTFGISCQFDRATKVVVVRFEGTMTDDDEDAAHETHRTIESYRASGVVYYVFDLGELRVLSPAVLAIWTGLQAYVQEEDGLVALTGLSNQPLQVMFAAMGENALKRFPIVSSVAGAREMIRIHNIAAMNQMVNPRYF